MPTSPTVYSFEDEKGIPLYIGKSIHPRTRVRQHLKQADDANSKQREFVFAAKRISFYPVESEIESLLLEARLIKLHQPLYNAIQKDDRTSLFIEITKDEYPRVRLVRGSDINGKEDAYGPFQSKTEAEMVLKVARKIFRFCANPPNNGGMQRSCFYYHLDQCGGVCVGKISKVEYRTTIGYMKKFLNGKSKGLLLSMERRIRKLAKLEQFEKAKEAKDMYEAVVWATKSSAKLATFLKDGNLPDKGIRELRNVLITEGVESSLERIEGYDVATLQQENTVGAMVVFFLGTALKSEYRKFKIRSKGGDTGAMREMLARRFQHDEWNWPDLVMVDGGKPQLSTAMKIVPKSIPVVALAKKEEIIVIPKEDGYVEIRLPRNSAALKLLQQVRDEAHRFGTGFHKQLRSRDALG